MKSPHDVVDREHRADAGDLSDPVRRGWLAGSDLGRSVDRARARTSRSLRRSLHRLQESRPVTEVLSLFSAWRDRRYSGLTALVLGTVLVTLLVLLFNRLFLPLPNPGVAYLPLIAMLAYYWSWRLVLIAVLAQLLCVYFLFLPPALEPKPLAPQTIAQFLVLIFVSVFILALVQLARNRRDAAEKEAGRFAALNSVGTALASEHDRGQLLELIAQTACHLTGQASPLSPYGRLTRQVSRSCRRRETCFTSPLLWGSLESKSNFSGRRHWAAKACWLRYFALESQYVSPMSWLSCPKTGPSMPAQEA